MGNRRLLWGTCAALWFAACGGGTGPASSESPAQQPAMEQAGSKALGGTSAAVAGKAAGGSSANAGNAVGGAGAGAGAGATAANMPEAGATASAAGASAVAAGSGGSSAAGAGAAKGDVPSDATDPSPGCADSKLMPGDSMLTLQSGGAARVYVQHIPPGYDGKTPLPVVLDLHGGSYDGPRWVDASGFKKIVWF